jgi:hypothetical protein
VNVQSNVGGGIGKSHDEVNVQLHDYECAEPSLGEHLRYIGALVGEVQESWRYSPMCPGRYLGRTRYLGRHAKADEPGGQFLHDVMFVSLSSHM